MPRLLLCVALCLSLPRGASAGSTVALPAGESDALWGDALEAAGLTRGGEGVLVVPAGEDWRLVVQDPSGERSVIVPRPDTADARATVAILAASLLRAGSEVGVERVRHGPASTLSPPPAPRLAPVTRAPHAATLLLPQVAPPLPPEAPASVPPPPQSPLPSSPVSAVPPPADGIAVGVSPVPAPAAAPPSTVAPGSAAIAPSRAVPEWSVSGVVAGAVAGRLHLSVNPGLAGAVRIRRGAAWLEGGIATFTPTLFAVEGASLGLTRGSVHVGARFPAGSSVEVRAGAGAGGQRWQVRVPGGDTVAWGIAAEAGVGAELQLRPGLAADLDVTVALDGQSLIIDPADAQPSRASVLATLGIRFGT